MKENEPDEGVERPRDIALILLKSGLNMLPFGGSLASLLEFIPTAHQKKRRKSYRLVLPTAHRSRRPHGRQGGR